MGDVGPTCSSILDHSQNQGGIKNLKRVLSQKTRLRKKGVQELRLCLILRCERSRLGLLLGSCGSINAVWAEGAQYTAQASPATKMYNYVHHRIAGTWTHSFLLFPIFLSCNHPSSRKNCKSQSALNSKSIVMEVNNLLQSVTSRSLNGIGE